MTPSELQEAVAAVRRTSDAVELEASGGITLENVAEIGASGVDDVSIGALTHSAPALDLSMSVE
jgi:nicotinate-nucleotide pyrophosphorylase (carboxylating)